MASRVANNRIALVFVAAGCVAYLAGGGGVSAGVLWLIGLAAWGAARRFKRV